MKKTKALFAGCVILIIAGGALAFRAKATGERGTVFCNSYPICDDGHRIAFAIGGVSYSNPCPTYSPPGTPPPQPYVIIPATGACVTTNGPFTPIDP